MVDEELFTLDRLLLEPELLTPELRLLPPELRTDRLFPPDRPVERTPDDLPVFDDPLRTPLELRVPLDVFVTPELRVLLVLDRPTFWVPERVRLVLTPELASLDRFVPTITPLVLEVVELVRPVYLVRVVSLLLVLPVLVIPDVRVRPVVLDRMVFPVIPRDLIVASLSPLPRLTNPVLLGPLICLPLLDRFTFW